jgi:choline dehydrogenase-like flavoprotein
LKVLTEAQATKILLEDKNATGVEFVHEGKTYQVKASREVVLSSGVIQSPQLLELSGIGDPEILEKAGVKCVVENKSVGANFQDHVLGGMLFDLADGVKSLDALHDEEYAKAQQDLYEKTQSGPYGNPGMLMGFVSYSSIVSKDELDETIAEIKKNSLAKTKFEKAQEDVSTNLLKTLIVLILT